MFFPANQQVASFDKKRKSCYNEPKGDDFKTKLTASIKNLGKVPKGEIGLGGFALLCGPNNTGKTYVSKVLYAVLRAANSNHGWNLVGHEIETLGRALPAGPVGRTASLRREIAALAAMPLHHLAQGRYAERVRAMAGHQDFCAKALHSGFAKSFRNGRRVTDKMAAANFAEIERSIKAIKRFAKMPEENVLRKSLESTLPALLLGSFMTPRMAALATGSQTGFSFDIKGVLGFSTAGNKCRMACRDLAEISAMPLVLYLDGTEIMVNGSPASIFSSSRSQRGGMAEGCPCYHSDFLRMLERPRAASVDLQDLQERIAETIGGKLEYRGGLLYFKDREGGRMKASLASAGVRQLGMLGLLIDRRLLQESATVFIDGPEANLYPEWQAALGEILTSLALRGINIVLATHSPYIIQHVKYRVRNDAFNEMLAVNHFSSCKRINGELQAFDNNHDRLRYVQKTLNETYMKTLLRDMASV